MKHINLRELINRLEKLSDDGRNDDLRVSFVHENEEYYITDAFINQDPDYNFDEANCGPDEWVSLCYE